MESRTVTGTHSQGESKAPQSTWPTDRGLQRDRTVEFFDSAWTVHLEAEERFLPSGRGAPFGP